MSYFRLSNDIADSGQFFTALDNSGRSILDERTDDLTGIPIAYFAVTTSAPLLDKPATIGIQLILSKRASTILRRHCRFAPEMKSIPAVFYRGNPENVLNDSYLLWWTSQQHNVLDLNASSIRYYKKLILHVDRWVLRPDLVPDYDIFLGPTHKWIVSTKFRNVCSEFAITGCEFTPLQIK